LNSNKASNKVSIWLEPIHLHFHHGDAIEVKLSWGSAMKSAEGAGEPKNVKALIFDPWGQESNAKIVRDGSSCRLVGESGPEGIYTVQAEICDMNTCWWAKIHVPVGHHVHGKGWAANRGMEIVPGEYHDFHPGDEIELSVLLQGKPMPGIRVQATHHLFEGEGFLHNFDTDEQGKARFTFDARGHWLFQVSQSVNDAVKIATLVIPGVR